MESIVHIKSIIDSSICEAQLLQNPDLGKYRLEIQPILKAPNVELCIVLFGRGISPWLSYKKAVIVKREDDAIRTELDLRFSDHIREARFEVYPWCQIFKVHLKDVSVIRFMEEKQLKQWEKPVRKAVERFMKRVNHRLSMLE